MRLLCKKYGVSTVVAIHQPRQEVGLGDDGDEKTSTGSSCIVRLLSSSITFCS